MRSTLIAFVVLGLTACSSSNSSSSSGSSSGGETEPCSISLTGAVTKTISCNSTAAYTVADDLGSLNITTIGVAPGASDAEVTFSFTVKGDLATKTYDWASSTLQQGSVVESNGTWASDSKKSIGTSTVKLTGLTLGGTRSSDKLYEPHGTVTATLVGQSGTTGEVTLNATF
jgi:hypothetical protein